MKLHSRLRVTWLFSFNTAALARAVTAALCLPTAPLYLRPQKNQPQGLAASISASENFAWPLLFSPAPSLPLDPLPQLDYSFSK
jgi:hypothetical protein